MSNKEDVLSQDPVDRARALYIFLLYTCGEKLRVKKQRFESMFGLWENEFAFLVSKQYVTVEGAVGRETIKITRTAWMEDDSPANESLEEADELPLKEIRESSDESSDPETFAFAFMDFPNILNKNSDKFSKKKSLSLERIEWVRFMDLIRNKIGQADHLRVLGYFHSRGLDRYIHEPASEKAALAGFEVKVLPPWMKDTDSTMIVDMMDVRFEYIPRGSVVTFLIGSGDRDYIPALERMAFYARRRGIEFKIIILSWGDHLTNIYQSMDNTTVVLLDEYFSLIDPIGATL